jgi:DNA-binding response OmpR family regulator
MATEIIEQSKLDNIDSLQIEYLMDLPNSKNDIIVIEPSRPVGIIIRKYLVRLGFENIFVYQNTTDGIKNFSDFINSEINVTLIIDDTTTNGNIKNIVGEVFRIQANANIIITTTKKKEDIQIAELFNMGVSSIIHKPIDFEELEKSLSFIIEKNNNVRDIEIWKNFKIRLLSYNRISLNRVQEINNIDSREVETLIKKAIGEKILIPDKEILEAACNKCNSVNISYISECPKCKGVNFIQQNLIEHYKCGEVYPKEINNTICPKCNKAIGSVGIDYREFLEHYVCNSCNDRFPKPLLKFVCLECNNSFIEKLAVWKKSNSYIIQNNI